MNNILEFTLLYDFYGELLTKKQKSIFELYYLDDLSLNEIAENLGVSRQAVSELLTRVKKKLYAYDKKLKLIENHSQIKNCLCEIKEKLDTLPGDNKELSRVRTMMKNVIDKL